AVLLHSVPPWVCSQVTEIASSTLQSLLADQNGSRLVAYPHTNERRSYQSSANIQAIAIKMSSLPGGYFGPKKIVGYLASATILRYRIFEIYFLTLPRS